MNFMSNSSQPLRSSDSERVRRAKAKVADTAAAATASAAATGTSGSGEFPGSQERSGLRSSVTVPRISSRTRGQSSYKTVNVDDSEEAFSSPWTGIASASSSDADGEATPSDAEFNFAPDASAASASTSRQSTQYHQQPVASGLTRAMSSHLKTSPSLTNEDGGLLFDDYNQGTRSPPSNGRSPPLPAPSLLSLRNRQRSEQSEASSGREADGDDEYSAVEDLAEESGRGRGRTRRRKEDEPAVKRSLLEDALRSSLATLLILSAHPQTQSPAMSYTSLTTFFSPVVSSPTGISSPRHHHTAFPPMSSTTVSTAPTRPALYARFSNYTYPGPTSSTTSRLQGVYGGGRQRATFDTREEEEEEEEENDQLPWGEEDVVEEEEDDDLHPSESSTSDLDHITASDELESFSSSDEEGTQLAPRTQSQSLPFNGAIPISTSQAGASFSSHRRSRSHSHSLDSVFPTERTSDFAGLVEVASGTLYSPLQSRALLPSTTSAPTWSKRRQQYHRGQRRSSRQRRPSLSPSPGPASVEDRRRARAGLHSNASNNNNTSSGSNIDTFFKRSLPTSPNTDSIKSQVETTASGQGPVQPGFWNYRDSHEGRGVVTDAEDESVRVDQGFLELVDAAKVFMTSSWRGGTGGGEGAATNSSSSIPSSMTSTATIMAANMSVGSGKMEDSLSRAANLEKERLAQENSGPTRTSSTSANQGALHLNVKVASLAASDTVDRGDDRRSSWSPEPHPSPSLSSSFPSLEHVYSDDPALHDVSSNEDVSFEPTTSSLSSKNRLAELEGNAIDPNTRQKPVPSNRDVAKCNQGRDRDRNEKENENDERKQQGEDEDIGEWWLRKWFRRKVQIKIWHLVGLASILVGVGLGATSLALSSSFTTFSNVGGKHYLLLPIL